MPDEPNLAPTIEEAIQAAKAGQKEAAQAMLIEIVEADPEEMLAWVWLSYVMDDLNEKETCYHNILTLDPYNEFARKGLAWLNERRPAPEPPAPLPDEFDNDWLCPYCTALTAAADKNCPRCRKPLFNRERESLERSVWLWRAFFLQLFIAFYVLLLVLSYYALFATIREIPYPLSVWPVYLGLPNRLPADTVAQALNILPRWAFWSAIAIAVYALSLMSLLYFRVPYAHLMYLFNSGLTMLIGLLGIFYPSGWVRGAGVGCLLLSILQLTITFNLWKDFSFKESRLRFRVDGGAATAEQFMLSARCYQQLGRWGLAALHLRRAVGKNPNRLDYHLALTVAYLKIDRADLAARSLEAAAELAPDSEQVKHLRTVLNQTNPQTGVN